MSKIHKDAFVHESSYVDDNVTVGGVSRKSGPAAGKKFPGKTIWYNN